MTKQEAIKEFFNEMCETHDCYNKQELIEKLGRTTIRCAWVDYCDSLVKDGRAKYERVFNWGQCGI